MKYINYLLLILFLTLINTSCLETLSGDNTKSIIPGLTIPVSDETEIAESVQEVHESADISSEIFVILGPLAGLSGASVSSLAISASSISDMKEGLANLGEHDPSGGHYTQGNSKIYFRDASLNIIYLDLAWLFDYNNQEQPALVYNSQDVNDNTFADFRSFFEGTMYLPGAWRIHTTGQPVDWKPTDYSTHFENYSPLTNNPINLFISTSLSSFKSMRVVTRRFDTERSIDMTYTVTMGDSFVPTDADPVVQQGSGTITIHKSASEDLVLTINSYTMNIGTNGPISGNIDLSRDDGYDVKMTYSSDGSSYSTIRKNSKLLATVSINAHGSGTYTDSSGKSYPISQ